MQYRDRREQCTDTVACRSVCNIEIEESNVQTQLRAGLCMLQRYKGAKFR